MDLNNKSYGANDEGYKEALLKFQNQFEKTLLYGNNDIMKEQIKELRVSIDGLAQLTKELKPIYIAGNRKESEGPNHIEKYCTRNSKEINKAYDSLILAKAWLGKILQELGEFTPYANDGSRKEVKDIEPTADKAKIVPGLREPFTGKNAKEPKFIIDTWELNGRLMMDWDNFNYIEKVDWLREEISNLKKIVKQLWMQPGEVTDWKFSHMDLTKPMYILLMRVEQHLSEARFWLGFELGRVRDAD